LLALRRAYAAQISVLDACLAGLLDAFWQSPCTERTLLFVAGARGYPLGEHGRVGFEFARQAGVGDSSLTDGLAARRVGGSGDALYAELMHVPWIWRLPDARAALGRSSALVQPADCCATLADWWELPRDDMTAELGIAAGRSVLPLLNDETTAWRDRALVTLDHERALRTASWYLRLAGEEAGAAAGETLPAASELYVKPDDRWERNEISARCEDVAAMLAQLADECHRSVQSGEPRELMPLPAEVQAGVS
jgi:arylsulfatase A-like enzyme